MALRASGRWASPAVLGKITLLFLILGAAGTNGATIQSLNNRIRKKASLHHVLQAVSMAHSQAAEATNAKAKADTQIELALREENECASVLRDNFQLSSENTNVKSAVRWFKNNLKAQEDDKNLFYLDDNDYITKTKCGMSSILLAALLGGVGDTPDTVLSHSWHLNEDIPPDSTEFLDLFVEGHCTHSPGYYHDNIALHILMRDESDDNDDNFTHQYLLQKHGNHYYLWQSFIRQYSLADWVETSHGSSEFSGRMDKDRMELFARLLHSMIHPDDRAQAYRIFQRLFYITDDDFDDEMDVVPNWKFEKHCFPYNPSDCWSNWRKLEMFADVIDENERHGAVVDNSMNNVLDDIQSKLLNTNWNYGGRSA